MIGPLTVSRLVILSLLVAFGAISACARFDDRGLEQRARAEPSASSVPAARPEVARALETLRSDETALRARTDFENLPPSSRSLGANPYALVALSSEGGNATFVGVLRGDSAVVVLDANANELSRSATVSSPNAIATAGGLLFVTGDIEPRVARYRMNGTRLTPDGEISIPEASSLRAVVADARSVFIADFWGDRLYSTSVDPGRDVPLASQPLCGGPIRLALTEHFLGVVCLFEHAISIFERAADGSVAREIKRVVHDGPIWGFSLAERGDELFVAAGGVEDHPLDRRDKAFGYVDSFAYLYRLDAARHVERLFALNTSELGVVTPKIARLAPSARGVELALVGYASDTWLDVEWSEGASSDPVGPRVRAAYSGVPGCSDVAFVGPGMLCANPLLDAWVELGGTARATVGFASPVVHRVRAVASSGPSAAERLGEALFFTTLMAPDVTSADRRSRFTCETCHFEGGTDGRVHHSGRGDVRVSTRPLLGLFNVAPHFSRAHDRDLTSVSHNEFRVANRGNPIDPWFSLTTARFPWLGELGVVETTLSPLELRRALLVFLARFSHAENPVAVRRPPQRRFDDTERRGAELFRERCAGCHAARLIARDASTEVSFDRWEDLVLSPSGPLVWSNGEYAKTGVTPYVDPEGTRTPSLRRLYLKRPYLTNGSAPTLDAVVATARFGDDAFSHAASVEQGERSLTSEEQRALSAFLRIL